MIETLGTHQAGMTTDLRTVLIPQCGHLAQEGAPDKANAALLDLPQGWTG